MLLLSHHASEPSPPAVASGPAPPTTADRVMAQLSNILSTCETSKAAAAKQLFEWIVTTSEKLADAESRLILCKQEEGERQQVQ